MKRGGVVIEAKYEYVNTFSEGLAPVRIDGKWGFIDKEGKIVINPQFDEVYKFSEGLAAIRIAKQWGFIDKEGKIAINPQYEKVASFKEGLAWVKINGNVGNHINKQGVLVINNPEIISTYRDFCEGFARVKKGKKWGYIDTKGKFVINPQFDEVYDFNNGLAKVKLGEKTGYINKEGKYVYIPQL